MHLSRSRQLVLTAAVFSFALILRLLNLGKTLDLDEMATAAWAMARAPGEVLALLYAPTEGNSAAYPLFLALWGKVALTERWLRLPSVLAGALTVGVFYRRNARRFSPEAALWASALLALANLPLHQSQNARAYALFALFAYLALDAWERRRPLPFALFSWLAISLHHFGFLYLAPLWLTTIAGVLRGRRPRRELAPILAAWLLYLPQVPLLLFQAHNGPTWFPQLSARVLSTTMVNLAWMNSPAATAMLLIPLIAGAVCFRRTLAAELAWGLFPILATAAVTLLVRPLFVERYFFPSTLALFGLVAGGWQAWLDGIRVRLSSGRVLALACVLCAAFALPAFYAERKTPDWRSAAEYIRTHDCSKLVVTDPFWIQRWPFYLSGYRIQTWIEGYPTEPFWLAGAGFPPLPSSVRAVGDKLGEQKWAGENTLVYCVRP